MWTMNFQMFKLALEKAEESEIKLPTSAGSLKKQESPPHVKSWLIGKDPDAGRIEGKRRGGYRGWDGWLASLTQWTWVWVNSGSWWWTGSLGMLWFMGSQRVGHNWATELTDWLTHASKVMLKILQARLQRYANLELPDVQAGFRKGRGIRDQIVNIHWIIEKAREFQKNIYFCFIGYAKAFDCVDHNKLWKILQEMGIPHHLTCLLRDLYAEATVRTGHGITDWF